MTTMQFTFKYSRFVCGQVHIFSRQFYSKRDYDEQSLAKLVRQKYGKESSLVSWEKLTIEK